MPKDTPPTSIRLRTKIGVHEFEAEGPAELVAAHFKRWEQLILAPLPSSLSDLADRSDQSCPEAPRMGERSTEMMLAAGPSEPGAGPAAPQTPVPPAAVGPDGQPPRPGSGPLDLFTVAAAAQRVALRLHPGGHAQHADAALLLLYGYRLAFGEDGQTMLVTRLKAALAASGYRDARVDRTLAPHIAARLVRKTGRRIGSTYELTPAGRQRAEALASALLASTPPATNAPRTTRPSP